MPGNPQEYDWDEVFEKYKTGNYTWPELAEEYGFNPTYASRKASERGVKKGQSRDAVNELAKKKRLRKAVIDEEADKVAQINEKFDKFWENLFAILHNETIAKIAAGEGKPDFSLLKSLKITTEIAMNIRSEQYQVNDIQEVAQRVEQEIYGKDGGDIELSYSETEEALEDFRSTIKHLSAQG